jgi:catechol 2,3-dioxygenase-like lactoylglutathione lyase family enzyme
MWPYGQRLRSLAFYRDVLGATVLHELPGTLRILNFAGSQILLSAPGSSRSDGTDLPLTHREINSELSIQVPDCLAAYELLRARGAQFIASPAYWREETRALFLDPDGYLLEIWEAREAKRRGEEIRE